MTYCRYCLKNQEDPLGEVMLAIWGVRGTRPACRACSRYLGLLPDERREPLLKLARQYAAARYDVVR